MGTASGSVRIDIQALNILAMGIKAGVIPSKFQESFDLNTGTTDGSIDLAFAMLATGVAASATTSFDCVAGGMTDPFGNVVSFAEIVLIAIRNKRSTAGAYLIVGPHAVNGMGKLVASKGFWGATADVTNGSGNIVAPDSWHVMYDRVGVPCVGGASDILAVVASAVAGDVNTWDLLIMGRSA